MSPPGKTSGSTTNESVVNASRSPRRLRSARSRRAWSSSGASNGLSKARTNTSSIRSFIALPPPPWASVTVGTWTRPSDRARTGAATFMLIASRWLEPAILIIGGAGAFGRNHQRAERRLRRAGGAERLALDGLDDASQHFAALAGLGIGDRHIRDREFALCVETGVGVAQPHAGMIDRTQAPPFAELAQFVDLRDGAQSRRVAGLLNDPRILIFDLDPPFRDLPQQHPDRLQDVQGLKAGDDHRLAISSGR